MNIQKEVEGGTEFKANLAMRCAAKKNEWDYGASTALRRWRPKRLHQGDEQ